MSEFVVMAFYKFVSLQDYRSLREPLRAVCDHHEIKGTILLAEEGINGTIAGTESAMNAILEYLRSDPRLDDLTPKVSTAEGQPFNRMKVRLKKEIVTMGVPEANPNHKVGTYVRPEDWNALISDPDVIVIDTRNQYEVQIGTFHGAVNPETASFRQFPSYAQQNLDPQKHTKVAMFCTGGIRCEKASSYLVDQGFSEVYHLEGGILKYLETVPADQSLWEGECFVFDHRVALGHGLEEGTHDRCHACGHPISPEDQTTSAYLEGISCPYCFESQTEKKRRSVEERQRQIALAAKRNQTHIGS